MRIEAGEGAGVDPGAVPSPPAVPVRVSKGPARSGRRALAVVVAVLLVGGLAAGAFALLGERERSPAARLAAARAAVEDADSYRFTVRTRRRPPDTSTVTSLTTERGRSIDGRRHVTRSGNVLAYEAVLDTDHTVYSRWATADPHHADTSGTLEIDDGVPWVAAAGTADGDLLDDIAGWGDLADAAAQDRPGITVDRLSIDVALLLYLTGPGTALDGPGALDLTGGAGRGTLVDPGALLATIDRWGTPVRSDGDTLTATLRAPDDAVEAYGWALPDGRVEVDLGADDLPRAARLAVAGVSAVETELTFSNWDDAMVLTVPAGDGIDRTPWLDEDGVRSTDVAPLVPPGVLNSDRLRVRVRSRPAQTVIGTGPVDCDVLHLTSQPSPHLPPGRTGFPAGDDGLGDGVLWLAETSLPCALGSDDTPFAPGGPGGHPSRTDPRGLVEVVVGDTVVEIGTRRQGADLDRLAAALAPTDAGALVAAAAEMPEGWALAEELF